MKLNPNKYLKLRSGIWGIKVYGNVNIDDAVYIMKSDGDEKIEIIGRIIWSGRENGEIINLCLMGKKSKKVE